MSFDPESEIIPGEHRSLTGNFRQHRNFHSKHLPSDRDVLVYLPPDYESDSERRYPVLYLHDGQNLFDDATAFGGVEWRVDETVEQMVREGAIEPLIVVGIYNTGEQRIDEYTHSRDRRMARGGKAKLYGRLLVEELKPFIDQRYRTMPNMEHTGLGGSSLGGLVTLYLGMRYPLIFGRLAIISPSVWWDGRSIIDIIDKLPRAYPQRIWLDMGTNEGHQTGIENARLVRDRLLAKGWVEGVNLRYHEAEGHGHNEGAWAERVRPILEFLFGRE